MADQAAKYGTEVYDETAEYDSKHGDPAKGCDHVPVNLTDSANKAPSAPVPFKITTSK